MWKKLQETLDLEDAVPSVDNTYLGCNQRNTPLDNTIVNEKNSLFHRLLNPPSGKSCDDDKKEAQQSFADSKELHDSPPGGQKKSASKNKKNVVQSGRVSTPHHVQQSAIKDVQVQPKRSAIKDMQDESPRSAIKDSQVATLAAHWQYTGDIKAWVYDMKEDTESCDKRYLELAKIPESKLHSRQVPCIDDHQLPSDDFVTKGTLEAIASRVVLKVLYTARMGRPDTLWSVNTLARKVAKWNRGVIKGFAD